MSTRQNLGMRLIEQRRRRFAAVSGPTLDTPTHAANTAPGITTLVINHTVPAGAKYLDLRLEFERNNAGKAVSGVSSSVDGPLTAVEQIWSANAAGMQHECWILTNPTAGAHTITITFSSAPDRAAAHAVCITGATTFTHNQAGASGTAVTGAALGSAAGRLVIGSIAWLNTNASLSSAGPGTSIDDWFATAASTIGTHGVVYSAPGAGTVTFSGTLSVSTDWAVIAVSYAP